MDVEADPGMVQLAIQSHTVRDIEASLPETVRRVGAAGYDGIEFTDRVGNADRTAVADALRETGLTAVGIHVDRKTLESQLEDVVQWCDQLDCSAVVVPHRSPSQLVTDASTTKYAHQLRALGDQMSDHGIDLLFHNTDHECRPTFSQPGIGSLIAVGPVPHLVGGQATKLLAQAAQLTGLQPKRTALGTIHQETRGHPVGFELDVGWVKRAGLNPSTVAEFLGDRIQRLHVTVDTNMAEVIHAARKGGVEWIIFENDHPDDAERALRRGVELLSPLVSDADEQNGDWKLD